MIPARRDGTVAEIPSVVKILLRVVLPRPFGVKFIQDGGIIYALRGVMMAE